MTFFRCILVTSLWLLLYACGQNESAAIENTFQEFLTQIATDDGQNAAGKLDRKTLEWFEVLVEKARTEPTYRLHRLNYFSKLYVLLLRQGYSKEELENLSKTEAFAYLAKHHFIGWAFGRSLVIESINFDDKEKNAILDLRDEETGIPLKIKMIKLKDDWKINLASIINRTNDIKTGWTYSSIDSENLEAEKEVVKITDKPLKENIWLASSEW